MTTQENSRKWNWKKWAIIALGFLLTIVSMWLYCRSHKGKEVKVTSCQHEQIRLDGCCKCGKSKATVRKHTPKRRYVSPPRNTKPVQPLPAPEPPKIAKSTAPEPPQETIIVRTKVRTKIIHEEVEEEEPTHEYRRTVRPRARYVEEYVAPRYYEPRYYNVPPSYSPQYYQESCPPQYQPYSPRNYNGGGQVYGGGGQVYSGGGPRYGPTPGPTSGGGPRYGPTPGGGGPRGGQTGGPSGGPQYGPTGRR